MHDFLQSTLNAQYGFQEPAIRLLKTEHSRRVYRVSTAEQEDMVVREYRTDRLPDHAESQIATLLYLEEVGFAAPRIIRNRSGATSTLTASGILVALSFMEGPCLGFDLPSMESLGEVLGRLHALHVTAGSGNGLRVPRSTFSPEFRVPPALQRLESFANRVPAAWRKAYDGFKDTLEKSTALESLPLTLVHSDPFPENAIRRLDGTVVLLDWDDAGLGQAAIDLGHALATSEADQNYAETLRPSRERILAIMKGYVRHRTLSAAEQAALSLAIAYTPAEYGANHMAAVMAGSGKPDHWQWWWTRVMAASETARVALSCL